MSNTSKTESMNMSISKIIFCVWFLILAFVTGLLIVEYRFFKEQAYQLGQLKNDYAMYIGSLKKLITEHAIKDQVTEDQKKKTLESKEQKFLVVNREPHYLKKSALKFARRHKLEWALQQMYRADEWVVYTSKERKLHKLGNTKKTEKQYAAQEQKNKESIFLWPLKRGQFYISSHFGPRKNPNGSWGFHRGIDLAAPRGTPVRSAAAGLVVEAAYVHGYGNTVLIAHDQKFKTRYAHLSHISVRVGQQVQQLEIIGKVGATGHVRKKRGGDGSHLHFEVYLFKKQVNPYYFLA
jgi:murein DD-endopeptidase MepM/ murein hydrolase activator NlpD